MNSSTLLTMLQADAPVLNASGDPDSHSPLSQWYVLLVGLALALACNA